MNNKTRYSMMFLALYTQILLCPLENQPIIDRVLEIYKLYRAQGSKFDITEVQNVLKTEFPQSTPDQIANGMETAMSAIVYGQNQFRGMEANPKWYAFEIRQQRFKTELSKLETMKEELSPQVEMSPQELAQYANAIRKISRDKINVDPTLDEIKKAINKLILEKEKDICDLEKDLKRYRSPFHS